MLRSIFLLSSFVLVSFFSSSILTNAETVCGSIIQTDDARTEERPIEDCENPFGATDDAPPAAFTVNEIAVNDGAEIEIDFSADISYSLELSENSAFTAASIYKMVDDDYILDHRLNWLNEPDIQDAGAIDGPGTYALVVAAEYRDEPTDGPILVSFLKSLFLPTAHAFFPDTFAVTVVTFTVTEAAEEDEATLSELLLKYEPILQFHEDEDYFPMNVDAFVEGSGLWDSTRIDEVLIPRVADPVTESNALTLEYLATTTDTSNWYITFSSDEAGEFSTTTAKARYDDLVEAGIAVPTYYAIESEHSYTDDLDVEHEFIVLQYWYFYAMNDWGRH